MSIYSPQQLVDQINEAYFPELFTAEIATKERTAKLKLAKQKLRFAKQSLKSEQTVIKKRYDNRNKQEAAQEERELIPYNLVETYMGKVELSYAELDAALTGGSALPSLLGLSEVFVGSEEMGGYRITTKAAAEQWMQELYEQKVQEAFAIAKRAIENKNYESARNLLKGITHPKVSEWLAMIDTREIEDKKKAIQDQLALAKSLIERKQYSQARTMLERIDHPTAAKWLPKVRELETKHNAQVTAYAKEISRKQARRKTVRRIIFALVTIFIIAVSAAFLLKPTPTSTVNPASTYTPTSINVPVSAVTAVPNSFQDVYSSETPYPTYIYPTADLASYSGGGSTCADGSHSSSTGRGTCSHHGGVSH